MKKVIFILLSIAILNSGCATIFFGTDSINHCKQVPQRGEPPRDIYVGALVLDILIFWPSVFVDLVDGAIWKPCPIQYVRPPSKQTLEGIMQSWVGHTESELLISWGSPKSTYIMSDGGKLLTWESTSINDENTWYDTEVCKKMFFINKVGIIYLWKLEGC